MKSTVETNRERDHQGRTQCREARRRDQSEGKLSPTRTASRPPPAPCGRAERSKSRRRRLVVRRSIGGGWWRCQSARSKERPRRKGAGEIRGGGGDGNESGAAAGGERWWKKRGAEEQPWLWRWWRVTLSLHSFSLCRLRAVGIFLSKRISNCGCPFIT